MKFSDLLAMSVNNLRRRKLRTFLTVLGVLIGTASIVVMVSLGIGLNARTMEQIASEGSLTEIQVYPNNQGGGNANDKSKPAYLTDDVVSRFRQIEHVKAVSPILNTNVLMRQGAYLGNVNIMGVTKDYMKKIPLKEGTVPNPDSQQMQMVVGNMVAKQFYNPKAVRGGSYSFGGDDGKAPDIDFLNQPVFVIFDTDAYYQSQGGGAAADGKTIPKPPKKYLMQTSGLVKGGTDDWNNYSYNVYMDLDKLKSQLKQVFKKAPIPGQPTTKKGKPLTYLVYDQAVVDVDDMKHVAAVQKTINDSGFQASSNMDWLEQSQKQSNMVQAVLGGIGAVSLFVAAIGIANTMMMSIYERTREIGIIKVLGCDMGNIRNMFLLESGFIGFIGGVTGIAISYGISYLANQLMSGANGNLSQIPPWLSLSAVGFAVFVGMAAGFFPALRAMRLSPLAAIRSE